MIIKFGPDTWDSVRHVLDNLAEFTIKVEYTGVGFPEYCAIVRTEDVDLVICDVDETGKPWKNCLYHVPYENIVSITVI